VEFPGFAPMTAYVTRHLDFRIHHSRCVTNKAFDSRVRNGRSITHTGLTMFHNSHDNQSL
jgi:hypothetical protein